jgi:nitrate reductase cytochrome c-type subunit
MKNHHSKNKAPSKRRKDEESQKRKPKSESKTQKPKRGQKGAKETNYVPKPPTVARSISEKENGKSSKPKRALTVIPLGRRK